MASVGAYFAKTHFSELLDRVEGGEVIVVTRHGRPVARLVAVPTTSELSLDQAVEELRSFRDAHPLGARHTVKQLIREGRRS